MKVSSGQCILNTLASAVVISVKPKWVSLPAMNRIRLEFSGSFACLRNFLGNDGAKSQANVQGKLV